MKNILVATDFSNDAYCALFYITKLMESQTCTFFLLNVYDKNTPLYGDQTTLFGSAKRLPELETASTQNLTATYHKIVLDHGNPLHKFQTISKEGMLVDITLKIIEEHQIDMVVMGTKGKTGAKEVFFGSNSIQLANKISSCPLFAVPKQIDFERPREIAFVTDLKKGCTRQTLFPLSYIATLTGASVRVMHINEEEILSKNQEANRKQLELYLINAELSFHWIQDYDHKAQVIDSFIEKNNVDILAMVHSRRSFFEKLVREPVIKDVSIYSSIPFLILPQQD